MEYLPEKKRTHQAAIQKHERKISAFREYLCDSEVVLAIVKCNCLASLTECRSECCEVAVETARGP